MSHYKNSLIESIKSKHKLALGSICLMGVSLALIFGARILVSQLALMAVLSAPELLAYTPAFCIAGYALMGAGVAGFLYLGLRSRFTVDTQRVKTQSHKLKFSVVALTCLLVVTSMLSTTSIVSANTMATTGYYLATPLPIADWYIGNYSTGNIFAINGSNWANLMTYPTAAPWASATGNYTQVWVNVLAATTSGTIYAKEVAFPLSLQTSIANNTQVICNYQGVTYNYINANSTLGSPYTVSVGQGINSGYYLAADSGNRIAWSSTDASIVMQAAYNSLQTTIETQDRGPITVKYGNIVLGEGLFLGHSVINIDPVSRVEWSGQGYGRTTFKVNGTSVSSSATGTNGYGAFNYNSTTLIGAVGINSATRRWLDSAASVTIRDMGIDVSDEPYLSGIRVSTLELGIFENLEIKGYFQNGTYLNVSGTQNTFGIYVYNSTSEISMTINNCLIEGFAQAFNGNQDHLRLLNTMCGNCYYGFLFNGGMDTKTSNLHAFKIYYQEYIINNFLDGAWFEGWNCEGVTSGSGKQIYISPASNMNNTYIVGVSFSSTSASNPVGGHPELVHWVSSTFVEKAGSVTFGNNQTYTVTHGLIGTPTVMWAQGNNTANTFVCTTTSTVTTITSSNANCNDTVYYKIMYYP